MEGISILVSPFAFQIGHHDILKVEKKCSQKIQLTKHRLII